MQGRERAGGQLLDAGTLVGHLVPAGSMFAFLAAHRQELFGDEDFADLFPSGKGRPSVPASVMASVMVLQVLHDYSDAEAAEAARCDLRWKAACGFPLDHEGFDPSTLVYWRRRIARSARPHRISDAVRTIVEETGVLKGRRRRAVDSTILADAVATQDTVTQLVAAVRRVGRVVPGAAELIAAACAGHDYSAPGKPRVDWDDPQAKDALVSALVNDANALVAALKDRELGEQAASAVGLLALVAGQDAGPAQGSDGTDGRWRIARKVAGDRPVDRTTGASPRVRGSVPEGSPCQRCSGTGAGWITSGPGACGRCQYWCCASARWRPPGIRRCPGLSVMARAPRSGRSASSCGTCWPAGTARRLAAPTLLTCCAGSGSWPRLMWHGTGCSAARSATSCCGCARRATRPGIAAGTARHRAA